MTGEITLRARILPIDGLKEKVLAAHRGDIHTVLIPKDNERDMKEVPPRVLKRVKLILVEHMDEVLDQALQLKPVCGPASKTGRDATGKTGRTGEKQIGET